MEIQAQSQYHKQEYLKVEKEGDNFSLEYASIEEGSATFEAKGNSFTEFQEKLKEDLVQMLLEAHQNNDSALPSISELMYKIEDGQEVADVPEYWNADNTSQRIVDFAMSFSSLSGLDKKDYIENMRDAIKAGFGEAKDILGELPGASAKLFNDTLSETMKKLDELLEESPEDSIANQTSQQIIQQQTPTLDLVA